ncbi:MAG: glycerol-3-phosphate 1-O-acyltransferase PlsY [Bacteroidales bacterium]|nr:glycerol-3-phosphate 1-O-acyltransferase PlsY [Bacteroidales bacterium]
MWIIENVLALIGAYLLGSVATSVWVSKIFYGLDIREHGSGNAGATNTFRVLGVKAGIPVLIVDAAKAFGAANLIIFLDHYTVGTNVYLNFKLLLGMMAVIGHILPIYVGFRGGKGVASLLGLVLAIHPAAALGSIIVFLLVLLISKYVSLSSMIAGAAFPILLIAYYHVTAKPLIIFAILASVALIYTHRKNINRIVKREESKANLTIRRRRR